MSEQPKKIPCGIGLLAHVDAGKTTLSDALLYCTGARRTLGRVDHQDAFLDSHNLERARGITIFSKQALLSTEHRSITLVDTPGHVDFSAEAERVMQVLDCAVLVISGTDGVQAHTLTLWKLLERYHVPTFLFVNKMDLPGADRDKLLSQLQQQLSPGCVDFGAPAAEIAENAAMCDEALLEAYLETGTVAPGNLRGLIAGRKIFPCCFGSGLKLTGVRELLTVLDTYAPTPAAGGEFAARVYKISRDPQGTRLTWMKITGGSLKVRTLLNYPDRNGDLREEKAVQLRLYSGEKFTAAEEVAAGQLCAVTGLSATYAGQGLGAEGTGTPPALEPVMTYRVNLPTGADPTAALQQLRQLEEEDPQLHILWDSHNRQIQAQIMGRVQLEILRSLVAQRFGLEITLDCGRIFYKETIENTVEGVGHFEPLRHYAEVHLLLEPLPRGSGLIFDSTCPTDVLDGQYQNLVLTHLAEKTHLGVLTGAPITDMKITLLIGRAHLKHTEGGDFRQATYRAVRQGLMQAKSVLLEPWYDFTLTLPTEQVGRAITDIRAMSGSFEPPEAVGVVSHPAGTGSRRRAGRLRRSGGGLHPGPGPTAAIPPRVSSLSQSGRRGCGDRLQPGGGSGQHAGFRILRPRRRVPGEMEPGSGVYASGKRLEKGESAPAYHPESLPGRQGAGSHYGAGIRPHQAAAIPGSIRPPRHGNPDHPAAQADQHYRGRLQHYLRLGGAGGNRQIRPQRRPAAAVRSAEQLRSVQKVPDHSGI